MSFATWYYPFFLAAVAASFWLSPARWRLPLVLAASFAFYGAWDIRFCALLIAAAASDYLCTRSLAEEDESPLRAFGLAMTPAAWTLAMMALRGLSPWLTMWTACACLLFYALYRTIGRLPAPQRRRPMLLLAIGVNLGILVAFKYANWFAGGLRELLSWGGVSADWIVLDVLLPIGISFHTFQSISYAVDVYQRRCAAEKRFCRVLCMIMFFPQLVAGPIERAARMLPQMAFETRFDWRLIPWALHLLLVGYFLKVFVADNCAVLADHYFAQVHAHRDVGAQWTVVGVLSYAAQIYGDFVGYSYIARGSAVLLGVELTRNFELPFLARSPADFWRRWHISLSTWIRDYVFLPLSLWLSFREPPLPRLSQRANDSAIVAGCLVVTMVLAGLWHGADWHFVAFGAYYGVVQAIWMIVPPLKALSDSARMASVWASRAITFACACTGWILFRSETLADAGRVITALGHASAQPPTAGTLGWLLLHAVPLAVLIFLCRHAREEADIAARSTTALAAAYVFMIALLASSEPGRAQFIYFQF